MENKDAPQELSRLAEKLFENVDKTLALEATDKLIELASTIKDERGNPLFMKTYKIMMIGRICLFWPQ